MEMDGQLTFEFSKRPTIKGFPELRWTGKRPYESTQYYPAQLKERYGEDVSGWINKIFWGDNLQVMSHLLKKYRGQVDLIYIDPPFDSKADYKKSIKLKGQVVTGDSNSFEEKQYGDIWTNDEYLQFMYERLTILRDLLSETGSIFLHCDYHRNSYLRIIMDELFGNGGQDGKGSGFKNEIIWQRTGAHNDVAMKLGRRFLGADINLGAIQTTTKRLIGIAQELSQQTLDADDVKYTGFEVYNVNNYDFFRNPVEARDLIIQALEIQPFEQSNVWDGEKDGRMVKIMPVNRIATKADLEELKANLPYKTYEKRKEENPSQPVEKITIVCMGHEPDLAASFQKELSDYKLDIEIVDILRDKSELELKREAEAEVVREGGKLVIRAFYPMNLLQKLSLQKEYVEDWRQLVESIMIDWNYDGVVMQPAVTDIPDKKSLVLGVYDIPDDAGTIKVKITDLLSESLEVEV